MCMISVLMNSSFNKVKITDTTFLFVRLCYTNFVPYTSFLRFHTFCILQQTFCILQQNFYLYVRERPLRQDRLRYHPGEGHHS